MDFTSTATATNCQGPISYAWTFGDGNTSNIQNPTNTYATPGALNWSLTVTVDGETCTQTGTILVNSPPCDLTCTADANPTTGTAPLAVNFTATATATNCEGEPAFDWIFGDGNFSNVQNPTNTYATSGNFNWTLTVTVDGETCTQNGTVTVGAPPCVLTCSASADPTSGLTPLTVNFTGAATATDCQGQPAFSWAFGDGGTSAEQSLSYTYSTAGDYTWTLTVAVDGETCTQSGTISVEARIPGDCDGSGTVTIGEVQKAINMHLRIIPPDCGVDCNGDGQVSIGELQKVINNHLQIPTMC